MMLAFTRRPQEEIYITTPDNKVIRITVTKIQASNKCTIGIDAPKDFIIRRGEIYSPTTHNKTIHDYE